MRYVLTMFFLILSPKVWLLSSILFATSIAWKKIKISKDLEDALKITNELYKNFNIVRNKNASEDAILQAAKKYSMDIDRIAIATNNEVLLGDQRLAHLKVELNKRKFNMQSIRTDVSSLLGRAMSTPDKYRADKFMKNLIYVNTTLPIRLPTNSYGKRQMEGIVKQAAKNMTALFEDLHRYCPEDICSKLERADLLIKSEEKFGEAKQLIKEGLAFAQTYYNKAFWTKLKDPNKETHFSDDEIALLSDFYFLIYDVDDLSQATNYTTAEKLRKCKQLLLTGVSKLRKIYESTQIQPVSIFANRIENLANSLKKDVDVVKGYILLRTAHRAIHFDSYLYASVFVLRSSALECEKKINATRKGNEKENAWDDFYADTSEIAYVLLQIAKNKHVKGFNKANTELQDVLDNIRDSNNQQSHLDQMKKVCNALVEFWAKNKNILDKYKNPDPEFHSGK